MKKKLQNLYLLLIVIFLYAPIMTLMVLSFNSSRTRAKWGGFTGKWYVSLFQDEAIMSTLYNTLIIALLSALIATVIGTLASIGIQSMNRKFRTFMLGVTNIPMLNADIVTGVSMMLHWIWVLPRSTLFSKSYFRISFQEFFPVSCLHLPCRWMIL